MEFRCYLEPKLSYTYFKFTGRHLGFSTSAYILASDKHQYNTSGMSVSEIMGDAVGILFLTSVELKLHVIRRSQVVLTTSDFDPPFLNRLELTGMLW